jgi:hypothetical protein
MRTLRHIHGRLHGRIEALPLRYSASWAISVILGAYLSLQLVVHGGMLG